MHNTKPIYFYIGLCGGELNEIMHMMHKELKMYKRFYYFIFYKKTFFYLSTF